MATRSQMQSNWEFVPHHLPDTSLREQLLLNSRVYDTHALMAAEVRAVVVARTTWSGPTPIDLSTLAKDTVCHECGKKGHFARDCWHQNGNKGCGKRKEGKKGRKGQGKGAKPKEVTPSRKVCHNCGGARSVTMYVNVRRGKKQAM